MTRHRPLFEKITRIFVGRKRVSVSGSVEAGRMISKQGGFPCNIIPISEGLKLKLAMTITKIAAISEGLALSSK